MKFKKIVDDFKVTSIYELKEIIDKDQREEEINKYIHTNEDVDLTDLYDLHYAYDKKIKLNGFYAIDGSNYIDLLQSHQKEDEQKVEGYLKDFKDKYPLLFQNKKTKKLIIDPIEKMFFGDLICYKNFLKDLASKSLFIDTSESDLVNEYYLAYKNAYNKSKFIPSRTNYFQIYANLNNDNVAEEFLAFNSEQYDVKKMLDLINSNEPQKNSLQIEISSNQIRFFVPDDFNSSKTPFSNQQDYKIEKFEERLINCKNGVYEINLYKDEIFEKNLETQKILEKKIQRLIKESQEEEAKIEKEYDYERDGSDYYEEKLSILDEILDKNIKIERLKNSIEELGSYFYHIKLI